MGVIPIVGLLLIAVAVGLYTSPTQSASSLYLVASVAFGVLGALITVLFAPLKHVPGRRGVKDQSKFKGSAEWKDVGVTDEPEQGTVRHGKKGILGLEMTGKAIEDKNGLVVSSSEDIKTTYDLIFGQTKYDSEPALFRCVQQHTFKDAMIDGKPNPKPMIVDVPGTWECLTYKQMKDQARAFGTCLRAKHGIAEKEKIAIWSGNSVEWMLADLACAAYNWTSVSIYDTLGPDAASYITADSGAQVIVCEDKTFLKVQSLIADPVYNENGDKELKVVVCTGKGDAKTKEALENLGLKVIIMSDAIKEFEGKLAECTPPKPDDMVTLMYTSGTTGMPKGVMLSHTNITATICMIDLSPSLSLTKDDVHLSYLPLAHIFERQNCIGLLFKGAKIYFASQGSKLLLPDLGIVRPTLFAGVPKVYENVRDAVKRKMTGIKKTLFETAMKEKIADLETGCGYAMIWDKLVFGKTKKALGGRVRFCITGGAPISKDTLQFVVCALAPIAQGYGATETSAASTLTMLHDLTVGHVGPPLGTAAIRLVDVPDMNYFSGSKEEYTEGRRGKLAHEQGKVKSGGEVWIGGPGVSKGYYDPSVHGLRKGVKSNGMDKKTKEDFFEEDGWSWFKTGDIGSWTDAGCLKIVDRRKNMFKTSLGEYVPVEEVEKVYQDSCSFADFVFLPKETKVSYVALCVVVSESAGSVMKWAKENGVDGDENAVVNSAQFKAKLEAMFADAAKEKKLQSFMKVKKANIHVEYLPLGYQEQWVAGVKCANGHTEQLLTATFKARRSQLDQYFAPHFKTIYPDRPADHILP